MQGFGHGYEMVRTWLGHGRTWLGHGYEMVMTWSSQSRRLLSQTLKNAQSILMLFAL